MRHKKKINHLGRQKGHREAMLANMASSLIMHKRIKTTTAKAKALKIFIEPLITKAKDDTTHSRRQAFSNLNDKEATAELFRDVAVKVGERPGGYTRIIKLGNRLGDNADMCIIELVDYNENMLADKAVEKKASSRRRRGAKKSTTSDQQHKGEEEKATPEIEAKVEEAQVVEEVSNEENAEVTAEAQPEVEDLQESAEKKSETDGEMPENISDSDVEEAGEDTEEKKD